MALAQVANQLLRSAGEGTEVVVNSPITGNGTSEQPLGIDENWHGQDGESVTFTVSAIPSGTRVTLSGAQGTESFDVMNGVDGTNGTDGAQGPAGPQGPQGDPGVQGETGPQGIQGERGPAGPQGEQGKQGPAGQDGAPGKSAYEIAVEDGFSGNVYEWLESLKGDPGEDGFSPIVSAEAIASGTRITITDAVSSTVFDVMNGEQGPSGAQGPQGPEGPEGPSGADGAPGKNAYELAVEAGFTGTSAEWLNSLVGPQGPEGPSGASGASGFSPTVSTTPITTGTSGTQVTITDLTGSHTFDIMNGAKGDQGPSGESYTGALMPLIGDNGIAVTSNAGNAVVEISSVAHDATLSGLGTVLSPLGVVSGGGKTYSGIAPIVVNNTEDKISADCIELSAGNGIDSVKLALGVIEVSSQGGSNFSSSAFGINQSLQVTALTSLGYYDTGIGNSNQLSGNSTNNLGWTMPSAYANVKNDIINDAMPVVDTRYSYKMSYSSPATSYSGNSGLRIVETVSQQVGTFRRVYSGDHVIGELVPTGYASNQYLTVSQPGALQWSNIPEQGASIVLVATSGDIPASGTSDGKVYIVTGN